MNGWWRCLEVKQLAGWTSPILHPTPTLAQAVELRLEHALPHSVEGMGPPVFAQWQGALKVWSFWRGGPLVDEVRAELEELFRRLGIPSNDWRAGQSK
jgi:hypothetical protein